MAIWASAWSRLRLTAATMAMAPVRLLSVSACSPDSDVETAGTKWPQVMFGNETFGPLAAAVAVWLLSLLDLAAGPAASCSFSIASDASARSGVLVLPQ